MEEIFKPNISILCLFLTNLISWILDYHPCILKWFWTTALQPEFELPVLIMWIICKFLGECLLCHDSSPFSTGQDSREESLHPWVDPKPAHGHSPPAPPFLPRFPSSTGSELSSSHSPFSWNPWESDSLGGLASLPSPPFSPCNSSVWIRGKLRSDLSKDFF